MHSLQETLWENVSKRPLKTNLVGKSHKLSEWPNFGFSNYNPDYIVLSAHLTQKFMSKNEISKVLKIDDSTINHFLNAASLLQILETKDPVETDPKPLRSQVSRFSEKLKTIFNFS
jgi:hypothetical protein